MEARTFIAAMLGPHDREDAEFDKVRLAPERVQDAIIFLGRKPMLGDDFGGDGGRCLSHGAPLAGSAQNEQTPCCANIMGSAVGERGQREAGVAVSVWKIGRASGRERGG